MQYIIFGAGEMARTVLSALSPMPYSVLFIVDNDPQKHGQMIGDVEIKSPQCLNTVNFNSCHILIAVLDRVANYEIAKQLKSMGFIPNRDFSDADSLLGSIVMDKPGRVSGYTQLHLEFEPTKTFDSNSMLAKMKYENRIFRLVKSSVSEYNSVYNICAENNLFNEYVVNTRIVGNRWNLPCELLLEHDFISPISYVFEWSPKMFSDYVMFMIRFIKRLTECNLRLLDGHTLNATIHHGKFVFLDFGAIGTGHTSRSTLMEFLDTHILPLTLMSFGQYKKSYMYLKNPGQWLNYADVIGYLNTNIATKLKVLYDKVVSSTDNKDILHFADEILSYTSELPSIKNKTLWLDYQNDEWAWSKDYNLWSDKMKNVEKLIRTVSPHTVIDLASNMGWYGTHLYNQVNHVICFDNDYGCVDNLWKRIKDEGIANVLPIYMNICSPTMDYYRDDAIGCSGIIPWRKNAANRFVSELAIALAIVHHLAFRQQLTFQEIIEQFSLFSNRYLLVEFVKQEDKFISDFRKNNFEWYTESNFLSELTKRYEILASLPSTPKESRTLYLCEKLKA